MNRGADHPNWRGDEISYRQAHFRVIDARGPATEHECRRCGGQAQQWAYDHLDIDEKFNAAGEVYSTDPDHYIPMCRSCHVLFDRRNLCRRGHQLTPENSYVRADNGRRWCRTCEALRKERMKARRAS